MARILCLVVLTSIVGNLTACQTIQASQSTNQTALPQQQAAATESSSPILTEEQAQKAVLGSSFRRETDRFIIDGNISSIGRASAHSIEKSSNWSGVSGGQVRFDNTGNVCMKYDDLSWGGGWCLHIRQTAPGVFVSKKGETTFRNPGVSLSN